MTVSVIALERASVFASQRLSSESGEDVHHSDLRFTMPDWRDQREDAQLAATHDSTQTLEFETLPAADAESSYTRSLADKHNHDCRRARVSCTFAALDAGLIAYSD